MMAVRLVALMVAVATAGAQMTSFTDGWDTRLLPAAAASKGAVCLDGTPGGYHFRGGSEAKKWMFHLQGGGWCTSLEDCYKRSKTDLGSSKNFAKDGFINYYDGGDHGLFSNNCTVNSLFCNWTMAYVRYCDGASFSGDVGAPVATSDGDIFFRGRRVLDAILDDMLARGMDQAEEVIVHGCSAGGLATFLHLDYIAERIHAANPTARVVGAPESGYFIDTPNWSGKPSYTPLYQWVAKAQNVSSPGRSGNLNRGCVLSKAPADLWQCFMAQYTLPHIQTPLFSTNALYDAWQMANIVQMPATCHVPTRQGCTAQQTAAIDNLWHTISSGIAAGSAHGNNNGFFLHSCVSHCGLSCHDAPYDKRIVQSTTYSQAFTNWYLNRTQSNNYMDGTAVNPTCSVRGI
eukprot:m.17053 g.17053  ORF g.17053 m.17053 type:complete len:403 (+) comp5379_c0_seq1:64-1272(+)